MNTIVMGDRSPERYAHKDVLVHHRSEWEWGRERGDKSATTHTTLSLYSFYADWHSMQHSPSSSTSLSLSLLLLSLSHTFAHPRGYSVAVWVVLSLSASAFLCSSIVRLSSPHVSSYSACLSVALHRFKSLSPCLYCCGGITNLDPCHTLWITDNQPIVFLYTTATPATPPFTLSFFFWAGGPKTSLKRILGHSAEIKVAVTHPAPI